METDYDALLAQFLAEDKVRAEERRLYIVEWRAQLCTWLTEAEQELDTAQHAMAKARARRHRAFRHDEVRAAEQHYREAQEALEEVEEQVEGLRECIDCWTPDGQMTDEARRLAEQDLSELSRLR